MGKLRKLPYQIIAPEDVCLAAQPYELLAEVRAENHFDCAEARIALAWRKGLKPNVDGQLILGQCVKLNDLQREMVPFDFVIVLNKEVWEDPEFSHQKKVALLDHEMCHAAPALDAGGDNVRDTKGRMCWRVRGHDIEEFREIVARHGCYKRDLEKFAEALLERKKEPLLAEQQPPQKTLGEETPAFLAMQKLRETCEHDGTTMTISTPGMPPITIKSSKKKSRPKDSI